MKPVARLSLETLRKRGEAFSEEISKEYYLAHAGHKATAELQPVYARYADVLGPDSLEFSLEELEGAPPDSDEQRSARQFVEWQAEAQSARQLSALDEREIAWEGSAIVRVPDGRQFEYEAVSIEIANCVDQRDRHAIEAARATLVANELAPIRRERFQRERDITEQLGIAPGYNATFELLSGVSLSGLRGECEQFLRDTQSLWDEVLPEFSKRVLGMGARDLTRGDALALFRAREFDAYFPPSQMESSILGQVRDMGIDPLAAGRIILDTGEREGKRSRAFCAPVRIPDEVYLVLRPHGGQTDWNTFLHELGHALHFANMRPDLPFEYRHLGDNSITEGYAMLFDHLMEDAGWLKRYTELGAPQMSAFIRSVGFTELHFLRRYCAKLVYETELYGGKIGWESLPDLYVEQLTAATTFRYNSADAFVDVDPHYYSARYLRAWQLQALLTETLVERYDADWWRNPRAGPWVCAALFGEGQREMAHEQAQRVSAKELSFAPLVRAVERMLG
ncbi:MAG TPA: hypothetical protein VK636_12375 [Gemmatimonadaceae bacterium]|nr:hypothetical protein [Gemmatimonadaceae bacterium]